MHKLIFAFIGGNRWQFYFYHSIYHIQYIIDTEYKLFLNTADSEFFYFKLRFNEYTGSWYICTNVDAGLWKLQMLQEKNAFFINNSSNLYSLLSMFLFIYLNVFVERKVFHILFWCSSIYY